jgi:hypothetical protein
MDHVHGKDKEAAAQEDHGRTKIVDIRTKTGLIIQKDGKYLVACEIGTRKLVWRDSPWDAWLTRKRENAKMVATATGGELMLFNPVAGQIRRYLED